MKLDEAVTLLLRAAGLDDAEISSRALAKPIVEILGCFALAIIQAGAIIRQKFCNMKEFCKIYSRRRQQLLSRQPNQADSDYKYTVYTTWEISIDMIEMMSSEVASNALALLRLFSFLHFDGISEAILKAAWQNMHSTSLSEWSRAHQLRMLYETNPDDRDPYPVREAITLLSSFSLISIDEVNNRLSMHPLVHAWARDRMDPIEQTKNWTVAASTLAISISREFPSSDHRLRRILLPHVDSLLGSCSDALFSVNDPELEMVGIAERFELVYQSNGQYHDALKLDEEIVQVRKKIQGENHPHYLRSAERLALLYYLLDRKEESSVLSEKLYKANKKRFGEEHFRTFISMNNLIACYDKLGRKQDALHLREKVFETLRKTLGTKIQPETLQNMSHFEFAISYHDLGHKQKAIDLREENVEMTEVTLGEMDPHTFRSISDLAPSYQNLGQKHKALEFGENAYGMRKNTLGEMHPDTLLSLSNLAFSHHDLGQKQKALESTEKVFEIKKRT